MNIWYRAWSYLLPAPMWLAEFFMRTVMKNPEVHDFFPASLAAIALGMLIPVLSPKKSHPLRRQSFATHSDEAIRQAAMVMLFLGTFVWLTTVYLSIGGTWPAGWVGDGIDHKFWISVTLYSIAFALNEWKERI